jgi:hypothetical protein
MRKKGHRPSTVSPKRRCALELKIEKSIIESIIDMSKPDAILEELGFMAETA